MGVQRGAAGSRGGGVRRADHLGGRTRDRFHPVRFRSGCAGGNTECRGGTDIQQLCCGQRTDDAGRRTHGRRPGSCAGAEPGPLDRARSRLRLLSPQAILEQNHLRLDDLTNRAVAAVRAGLQRQQQRLTVVAGRYRACSPEPRMSLESHRLLALWKRLQAASPVSVLNRGFVIVRDENGRPIPRRAAVMPGQRLANEFADGRVNVRAESE